MESLLHGVGERTEIELRGPGERILEILHERGALFARELGPATGLLPVQVEEGLKELVAQGLVTCDGFAPLRRLLGGRHQSSRRRRGPGRVLAGNMPGPEGRWGLLRALSPSPESEERAERSAWRLLRRYGVVFRDLLGREWVPEGWREVHRALRTLEARGLVRGGRFVSGFTGEQFALPEAVPLLRKERHRPRDGEEVRVSAADPLNLAGILTPGPRVPAGHSRWLIFRDGIPVSTIERGQRVDLSSIVTQPRKRSIDPVVQAPQ
jgi:ATP-dependent Lhr-like helicase